MYATRMPIDKEVFVPPPQYTDKQTSESLDLQYKAPSPSYQRVHWVHLVLELFCGPNIEVSQLRSVMVSHLRHPRLGPSASVEHRAPAGAAAAPGGTAPHVWSDAASRAQSAAADPFAPGRLGRTTWGELAEKCQNLEVGELSSLPRGWIGSY